ncbi:hypothetical protein T439DRAFT_376095 [Meredithblackwellia eburnea MCA 4105]
MAEEVFLLANNQLEKDNNNLPKTGIVQLALPRNNTASNSNQKQIRKLERAHARHCHVSHSRNGINLFDLRDQTPLSSITLGPSYVPSTAPVARSTPTTSTDSIRIKSIRRTWVAVTSPNGGSEGAQVWSWTEEERKDGSVEGEAVKATFPIPQPLSAIAAPGTLPEHLVLLSSTGTLSLVPDNDLSTPASLPPASTSPLSQSLKLFPISASSTSALLPPGITSLLSATPSSQQAHLAVIVRTFPSTSPPSNPEESLADLTKKKFKKTKRPSAASVIEEAEKEIQHGAAPKKGDQVESQIELALLDPEVMRDGVTGMGIVSLGKISIPASQVVVSDDGVVTSLTSAGQLTSQRLSFSSAASFAAVYADLFTEQMTTTTHLVLSPNPIKSLQLSSTSLALPTAKIVALHASFVLLVAAVPASPSSTSTSLPTPSTSTDEQAALPASPRLTILIWDMKLGAIVSESDVQIPSGAFPTSTPASGKRYIQLSLDNLSSSGASGEVALVVAPSPIMGNGGRSLVYIIPYSLPTASVLATVVGKHAITKAYLAPTSSTTTTSSTAAAVVPSARKLPTVPPSASAAKIALVEEGEKARAQVLAVLGAALVGPERNLEQAEEAFTAFISNEKENLVAYLITKLELAEEREKERREKAFIELDKVKTTASKFRIASRKIEEAIAAAGKDISWDEVTAKKIKGVNDVLRYKYYEVRKAKEKKEGKLEAGTISTRKSRARERALGEIAKQEPRLPSSFVTSVLRLCLGTNEEGSSSDLVTRATPRIGKHPTGIIRYLLERSLVGDNLVPGGVTVRLARAGDWPNVHLALSTMPDIPESTTVSLLKTVLTASTSDQVAMDSTELPFPTPSLEVFLASFVESPTTPALLRQALQEQLSALEVLAVLQVLDEWLKWWAKHGGGGGQIGVDSGMDWKAEGKVKPKRLPTNPFVALAGVEVGDDDVPPRIEDILPLVQAILDSHFVNLLLQRQSHALLRRLSRHIATHVAIQDDLTTLLASLSVYSRAYDDQREVALGGQIGKRSIKTGFAEHQEKTLGKSMAAKIAAQEKHAEVGEYQVDKFWL